MRITLDLNKKLVPSMSWKVIEFFKKSICLSRLPILVYTLNIRVYYLNT
nr:MAG TPA: hypothetical protein [Caudoviricetes sp.]